MISSYVQLIIALVQTKKGAWDSESDIAIGYGGYSWIWACSYQRNRTKPTTLEIKVSQQTRGGGLFFLIT